MRRFPKHRPRRPAVTFMKSPVLPGAGLPVAPFLLEYVRNLLPGCGADETFYNLACGLLGRVSYRRLDGFVRPWRAADAERPLYFGRRPQEEARGMLVRAEMPRELEQLVQADPGGRRLKSLHALLEELLKTEAARLPAMRTVPQLDLLVEVFRLDDVARRLVVFLYCRMQCQDLDGYFDRVGNSLVLITIVARALKVRPSALKRYFSSFNRLAEVGLIEHFRDNMTLPVRVVELLAGISDVPVTQQAIRRDTDPVYPEESFPIPARDRALAAALLGAAGPCRILLYGKAGTGKTEFARTLARASGRPVYHVVYDNGENDGGETIRHLAVRFALYLAGQEDAVLIIDEADSVLNTGAYHFPFREGNASGRDKGRLNELLDSSHVRAVWITNHTAGIEESTKRRFSYSLEFPDFTLRQRENLWQTLVSRHPLRRVLPLPTVTRLAAEYRVNAGGIVSALDALAAVLPAAGATPAAAEDRLRNFLEKHHALTGGSPAPDARPHEKFDLAVLNTDSDPVRLVASLQNWTARRVRQGPLERRGASLLFWGAPGTGKTEFAKHLARELGLEAQLVRASDLLGPFVGMTERLVRGAFRRAAATESLLLVDEADSFLGERTRARHSWEVSFVNEFLTQLENHSGLVICTTNLSGALDQASLRRFHWKVRFDPLTADGTARLLAACFGIKPAALPLFRREALAALALTPGDFRAVAERLAFLEPGLVTPEYVAAELMKEAGYRKGEGGAVGFTA